MVNIDYTHIFEDSLNEIYVFFADTLYFLEVNRGARENLGYTTAELRSMTPLDLKPDHTLQTFTELIMPLRDGTREKIIFETRHCRKDGTHYPVEVHLHLSEIDNAKVFVAIILDVTERVEAEKRTLQLAVEQERVRLLHEFINDVSHDLRTPLTQASTSLYLLSHHSNDPKQQKHTERIEQALARVQHMIDSMLQMNELDLQDSYETAPVDLNAVLTSIVEANDAIADQRGISLRLTLATPTVPIIRADVHYLMRAIENVLFNALTYTEAGGAVVVQTGTTPGYVRIKIHDTGIGIDSKHLPHIFKRFYRADNARSTATGSNGLGLAIAKKILDQHDGTIDVASVLGEGTMFTIKLPVISQAIVKQD